ncbi:MAG: biliverdin-producing heme oxygenase [Rhodospirillales bacterium]
MAGVTSIREQLKRATAPVHARLERDLGLAGEGLSRPRYIFLLARFYGFHAAWEPAMARVLADDAFWAPRRRAPRLAADLNAYGFTDTDMAALPVCPELPRLDTTARALGSLYVLEGSRLGGAVVARNLAAVMGARDRSAYFDADRGETARLWREYLVRLEGFATPGNAAEIVAAAGDTFDRLHRWLCRGG